MARFTKADREKIRKARNEYARERYKAKAESYRAAQDRYWLRKYEQTHGQTAQEQE